MSSSEQADNNALFIIAGGRAMPDVMALLSLRPRLVHIITSEEGWRQEQAFCDLAKSIPGCHVEFTRNVDAYNFDTALQACRDAYDSYANKPYNWTFEITAGPKLTSIAAYELAKEKQVPCWLLGTTKQSLASLVMPSKVDTDKLFNISIDDFMRAQGRIWTIKDKTYRRYIKRWEKMVRELALWENTVEATELCTALYQHKKQKDTGAVMQLPAHLRDSQLVALMIDEQVITYIDDTHDRVRFASEYAKSLFGTGDWLEYYVWNETIKADLEQEQNCQWGCSIKEGSVEREFDLVLIHNAQLLVAECKAERDSFKAERQHLHKLAAKANVLGGEYVGRLFITNQPKTASSYQTFEAAAKQYNIVVVTKEELAHVGNIIQSVATQPKYARI